MDPTIRNKTITRLKEEIPELSPRLQVAAKYIVDHPADFGLDSIRDTARKADVSTYTLVRISERLGFDSYEDMRDPFRVALVAPTQFIDAPEWINRWRESGEIGQKQAEAALNSMAIVQRSLEGQNLKQLQRVAEMLLGAKNVYLTAVRASYSIAYYFHYVGRMALPSLQLIPRHINSAIDELNYADEGDVMIAITLTPYSRETIEACEFARKKGVKLVMISDSEVISSNFTPEETLVASTLSTHHFGCYTGVMAVAENLVSLLVALGGQDVKDRITSYETLRKDNNAYWVAKKKHQLCRDYKNNLWKHRPHTIGTATDFGFKSGRELMVLKQTLLASAATVALGFAGAASAAEQQFITIGTGGVTGVYYPTGGAICRLVNKDRKEHGIRCSVESTGGSVYNTRTIREGELEFGVVQSDVQKAGLDGTGAFEADGPFEGLRALFSVHPEPMHLMARKDANIASVEDLKGKKVNIANPGSGTRVLADTLMQYSGLSADDFALAAELKSSEQAAALCDGKIDATIWASGLPNGSSQEATSSCDVNIVPLSGENIDTLLAENTPYAAATIPGGMYPGNPDDIPSWGPKATFVTSADVSDEVVYAVVSAVFENFDDFKKLHPAFARLSEEEMVSDALSAEIHPGAMKYYKERGWK